MQTLPPPGARPARLQGADADPPAVPRPPIHSKDGLRLTDSPCATACADVCPHRNSRPHAPPATQARAYPYERCTYDRPGRAIPATVNQANGC